MSEVMILWERRESLALAIVETSLLKGGEIVGGAPSVLSRRRIIQWGQVNSPEIGEIKDQYPCRRMRCSGGRVRQRGSSKSSYWTFTQNWSFYLRGVIAHAVPLENMFCPCSATQCSIRRQQFRGETLF